jgi:hypothetical protein
MSVIGSMEEKRKLILEDNDLGYGEDSEMTNSV